MLFDLLHIDTADSSPPIPLRLKLSICLDSVTHGKAVSLHTCILSFTDQQTHRGPGEADRHVKVMLLMLCGSAGCWVIPPLCLVLTAVHVPHPLVSAMQGKIFTGNIPHPSLSCFVVYTSTSFSKAISMDILVSLNGLYQCQSAVFETHAPSQALAREFSHTGPSAFLSIGLNVSRTSRPGCSKDGSEPDWAPYLQPSLWHHRQPAMTIMWGHARKPTI